MIVLDEDWISPKLLDAIGYEYCIPKKKNESDKDYHKRLIDRLNIDVYEKEWRKKICQELNLKK